MLCFSTVIIVLSFGIPFLLALIHILSTAIKTGCQNITASHIVILGKKLRNNTPDKGYRFRLDRAVTIATDDTRKQIYILGGITGDANISESKAGQRYLEDNNIQSRNIHIEEKSRDTIDNMKQLKTNIAISEKHICLITNRYHLARASLIAKGFDFDVDQCAAEDSFRLNLMTAFILLVEAYYLHWYLTGCIYAKLTRNQRMLSRVQ